jgi:hypothetical protein
MLARAAFPASSASRRIWDTGGDRQYLYAELMSVLESLEQSLQELPDVDRDQLGQAFVTVVQLVQETTERLPEADRHDALFHVSRALPGLAHAAFAAMPGTAAGEMVAASLAEAAQAGRHRADPCRNWRS